MDFALFIFVLKAATAQDIPHEDTTWGFQDFAYLTSRMWLCVGL
jgi:hypothetical protein